MVATLRMLDGTSRTISGSFVTFFYSNAEESIVVYVHPDTPDEIRIGGVEEVEVSP